MFQAIGYEVSYQPDAFQTLQGCPSWERLQEALRYGKDAVLTAGDGDWMIMDKPHASRSAINLTVLVPAKPNPRAQLFQAVECFERGVTARLNGFVNRDKRTIEEDKGTPQTDHDPRGEPDEVHYPIPN